MFKPGLKAGIIGAVVSVLLALALVYAYFLPSRTAAILSCLSTPIGLVVGLAIGLLAARFALAQTQEKLTAGKTALAGVYAGLVSFVLGTVSLPISRALQNTPAFQARMVDIQVEVYRMMGMSADQIEQARAAVIAAQKNGSMNNPGLIAIGLVIGLVLSVGLGAIGGALGVLIFKPKPHRKLVCEKCQAAYELGSNAMLEVKGEGIPDLVDYGNWEDLLAAAAKQQRALIEQAFAPSGNGHIRQWQCGMCKTVQAYPQPAKR